MGAASCRRRNIGSSRTSACTGQKLRGAIGRSASSYRWPRPGLKQPFSRIVANSGKPRQANHNRVLAIPPRRDLPRRTTGRKRRSAVKPHPQRPAAVAELDVRQTRNLHSGIVGIPLPTGEVNTTSAPTISSLGRCQSDCQAEELRVRQSTPTFFVSDQTPLLEEAAKLGSKRSLWWCCATPVRKDESHHSSASRSMAAPISFACAVTGQRSRFFTRAENVRLVVKRAAERQTVLFPRVRRAVGEVGYCLKYSAVEEII
jgi:hypothetical protein